MLMVASQAGENQIFEKLVAELVRHRDARLQL